MPSIPGQPDLASYYFFTTVRIDTVTPEGPCRATGFFFTVDIAKNGEPDATRTCVVTNRHVVEDATRIEISTLQDQDGTPVVGRDTGIVIEEPQQPPCYRCHPRDDVDIAIIPLSEWLQIVYGSDIPRPHISTISPDNVLDPDLMQQVQPLESVAFVGYPAGLYDRVNFTPIARTGVIATPPALPYEGLPAFVIDAFAFPGSSGSPVLLRRPGFEHQLMLIGVLASGPATTQWTGGGDSYSSLLNLGVVFHGWTITECIDHFLDGETEWRRVNTD